MFTENQILVGVSNEGRRLFLNPRMANRHGLIAGATGTGKTVTLKVLAESFSEMGVPVFLADVKGDISGMGQPGNPEKVFPRLTKLGIPPEGFHFRACPVRFWDVYGRNGIPVRTEVSVMGPLLLARLMELTPIQEGVLNLVFKIADDAGLFLDDWKDLRSMLLYVGNRNQEYTLKYGNISKQSIGAIQRALLRVENDGGDFFFGRPGLDILDWIQTASDGRGMVNILHAVELYQKPTLYATFLLWMLSELFGKLPEIGDAEKPKMVFFFDEAHLLFTDAPKVLVQKVEQVVRLIRSKGVGVYFITQKPSDIPDSVLAQLGNRIQHALRAYTPSEQKGLKSAAASFRKNPKFDSETAISELGTGEALVSLLDENGRPGVAEIASILPPSTFLGPIEPEIRREKIQNTPLFQKYSEVDDRISAYETLEASQCEETLPSLPNTHETKDVNSNTETPHTGREQNRGNEYEYTYFPSSRKRKTSTNSVPQSSGRAGRPRKTTGEKIANLAIRTLGKCIERTIMGILRSRK